MRDPDPEEILAAAQRGAARPYFELERHEASPKLPYGYFGMVLMTQLQNGHLIRMLTDELRRRRLGPFAVPDQQPETTSCCPTLPADER